MASQVSFYFLVHSLRLSTEQEKRKVILTPRTEIRTHNITLTC